MLYRQIHSQIQSRLAQKKPLIQALIGPRQVGKTTVAQALFENWSGPKVMESADLSTPPTPQWIDHHWNQARMMGPGTLLILDEIQKVPRWSEQVKALFDEDRKRKNDIRVLLLGSSSLYLQKGLSESLTGRFELTQAPHWSYAEFKKSFGWTLDQYIRFGAYPGAVPFSSEPERWRDYVRYSIIEPVLLKDILGQSPVQKPALFRQTFELAMNFPAQVVSYQKLLGQLQDHGNATTIRHYLEMFEQAYLIRCVPKYAGSFLSSRTSSPKIIVLNPALIHAYHAPKRLDIDPGWYGYIFENLMGAHFSLLPHTELYYWRKSHDEVDFVLKRDSETIAIEIKSHTHATKGKGVQAFSKAFPKIRCETWNLQRCTEFLETGEI